MKRSDVKINTPQLSLFILFFIHTLYHLVRICSANNDKATLTPMLKQKYPDNNTAYSIGDRAVAQCSIEGLDQELKIIIECISNGSWNFELTWCSQREWS